MNISKQKENFTVGAKILADSSPQEIGESFVAALATKDFHTLEHIFHPQAYFRGLVPSNVRNGSTAGEAVRWLRDWFGDEETIEVLQSSIDMVQNVLSIQYRLRVFDSYGGWQVIEQHAYCVVQEGRITEMRLVCSGFLPAPNDSNGLGSVSQLVETKNQSALVDTLENGKQDPVRDGLLEFHSEAPGNGSACALLTPAIKSKLREMQTGQVLEVRVDDPDAKGDIEAWSRLSGNALLKMIDDEGQILRFFVQKK